MAREIDPPPRALGAPTCTFEGTVTDTSILRVRTRRRVVTLETGRSTRFAGFERSSVPYLARGERVRVRGHECRGRVMIPRRVELRP